MANWAKQAAEQFLHIDGVKNRVDPLDSDDPYRPDSPSILKPSGSFVAAQVVNVNVNGTRTRGRIRARAGGSRDAAVDPR